MRTGRIVLSIIAAVVSLALLTSCGQEDASGDGTGAGGDGTAPDETADAPSEAPPTSATPLPTAMPQSVVDQAVALLADQLGVPPDAIEVARAVEVTWRDGAIGCPKPGFMYTQALVPGQLIELVVDGQTYAFHQAAGKPPFYCPNPTEAPPS